MSNQCFVELSGSASTVFKTDDNSHIGYRNQRIIQMWVLKLLNFNQNTYDTEHPFQLYHFYIFVAQPQPIDWF